jgi:hypothetical protein
MRWQQDALAIVFDNLPLGDHPTPASGDRYRENKLWEQDGCARTLVAARLNSQIVKIETIPAAVDSTPDFVAYLRDGRKIAIEHTRVTSKEDRLLRRRFNELQGRLDQLVLASPGLPTRGVTFTFERAPGAADAEATAQEMLQMMKGTLSTGRRDQVGKNYTRLHSLGVDVKAEESAAGTVAAAIVRPSPVIEVDARDVAETVTILKKKNEKIEAYSAFGEAVWFTVWVDVRFCLPTSVLRYVREAGLDLGKAEKIVVACTTA